MTWLRLWSAGPLVLLAGCSAVCEEPLSDEGASIGQANLSPFWSDPKHARLVVVRAVAPYRIPEFAVDRLREVLSEQVGLEVEVIEGGDPGLPAAGVLDEDDVMAAGRLLAPDSIAPVVVVVEVSDSNYGGYGVVNLRPTPYQ